MINITNMATEQYYSIEEIAKMLKVAYLTVYRWIRAGKLKAYKIEKQYRINTTDFKEFLDGYKLKNE